MQTIKRVVKVPADRELRIKLPDEAAADEEVEVVVLFNTSPTSFDEKIAAVRLAATDPLFLADINQVSEDFEYADLDEWPA
jgi:hypothetical protein